MYNKDKAKQLAENNQVLASMDYIIEMLPAIETKEILDVRRDWMDMERKFNAGVLDFKLFKEKRQSYQKRVLELL